MTCAKSQCNNNKHEIVYAATFLGQMPGQIPLQSSYESIPFHVYKSFKADPAQRWKKVQNQSGRTGSASPVWALAHPHCCEPGARGPTMDLQSFHSFYSLYTHFPPHCLGIPTIEPFVLWCVKVLHWHKGPAGMRFVQCDWPCEGYTEGTPNLSRKHLQPLSLHGHIFCLPVHDHIFPFMTFSAQHMNQSKRNTNYVRETGSGLRRFFIRYMKKIEKAYVQLN